MLASAALAAAPIAVVLVLLGVLRKPAWIAGCAGLAVTMLLALAGYRMPVGTAVSASLEGAAFGLFPITWIVFWAIALFRVTAETGQFAVIKDSIGRLTSDTKIQVLLIAFAFGAFVEGAAGFGTPVAIASTMLMGLGLTAFDASALCLLANTAPVAFGSIGIPIVTLALTTGLPVDRLSAYAGILCAPVALILPGYLIVARWGWRAMGRVWVPALTAGVVFSGVQLFVSTRVGVQLTDILASLAAIAALIVVIRLRGKSAEASEVAAMAEAGPTAARLVYAWLPYGFLVICVLLWGWPPLHAAFETLTVVVRWPLLHDVVLRMPPIVAKPAPYHAVFNLNWCAASGTSCMVATLLSVLAFRMRPGAFGKLLLAVTRQLMLPTVTVTAVLAMAFLMNYSGATATLGLAFAATGKAFPFFSALLGWVGVFLTGSDTSSNALFGTLQTVTAERLGFNPMAIAAVNSVGGTMGKMISLQTIAVAAAATGISVADQARLFRFTLKHSLLLVGFVGLVALVVVRL